MGTTHENLSSKLWTRNGTKDTIDPYSSLEVPSSLFFFFFAFKAKMEKAKQKRSQNTVSIQTGMGNSYTDIFKIDFITPQLVECIIR